MPNTTCKMKHGFSYNSNENYFNEVADTGYRKNFHLLTSEHLLQVTVFEEMVECEIFNRNPKKCLSPVRVSLHDW